LSRGRFLIPSLLLAVALLVRVAGLETIPPGFFADEAYTGYDAYCLQQTGADLWGRPWPLYFASWGGDAEEGMYRYLCLPFVALLGPTPLAVRLPAALVGAFTVLLTYLLGRRLLGGVGGAVAAGLLALSPWHVAISRIGFRAILLPAAVTASAWLLCRALGIREGVPGASPPAHPRTAWLLAFAMGAAALYTYAVAKAFVPLFGLWILWVFRREARRRPLALAGLLTVAAMLAAPAAWETISGRGQVRFERISALRSEVLREAEEGLWREHPALRQLPAGGARATTALVVLSRNYLAHATPRFLFVAGDGNLRHGPGGLGQLFWIEGALLAVGIATALRRRAAVDGWLVGWLLLGPLPDSITSDRVPNALRSLVTLPAPELLAGAGAAVVVAWAASIRLRHPVAAAAIVALPLAAFVGEGARFAYRYTTSYPAAAAPFFNAGYAEGILALEAESPPEATLLVARPEDHRVERFALNPYLHSLILFHTRRPPAAWQGGGGLGRFDVVRIPESGRIGAAVLPPAAWMLLPADRAAPESVRRWIPGPDGRPLLAIISRRGGD